jgi:hypothetical protein
MPPVKTLHASLICTESLHISFVLQWCIFEEEIEEDQCIEGIEEEEDRKIELPADEYNKIDDEEIEIQPEECDL